MGVTSRIGKAFQWRDMESFKRYGLPYNSLSNKRQVVIFKAMPEKHFAAIKNDLRRALESSRDR